MTGALAVALAAVLALPLGTPDAAQASGPSLPLAASPDDTGLALDEEVSSADGEKPTEEPVAEEPITDEPTAEEPPVEEAPAEEPEGEAVEAAAVPRRTLAAVPPANLRDHVLTRGHIDLLEVVYDPAVLGLRMRIKDDTNLYRTGVEFRDPGRVSIFVDTELTRWRTPTTGWAAPLYGFIGEPGTEVYRLPLSYDQSLPWPGWSTERLAASLPAGVQVAPGNSVAFAVDVTGPGDVFSWALDVEGEPINRYIDTRDPAPDLIPAFVPSHVHTNWAFTEPGDYALVVTPSLETFAHGTLTGESVVYHVRVGGIAELAPRLVTAPAVTGAARVGSPLGVDTGGWSPLPHATAVQWLRDGEPIAGATGASYLPVADDEGRELSVRVTATISTGRAAIPGASTEAVSTPVVVAPSEEPGDPATVTLGALAGSYAQGDDIALRASVDPGPAPGETLAWEWRWPGAEEWIAIPGASGLSAALVAEQALDGVELRVRLARAVPGNDSVSETRTVRVDDRGAAPLQLPSVTGGASPVTEGDTVVLTAAVSHPTVLEGHRWERRAPGAADFQVLPGETGAVLSFAAGRADDGAEYRVSLATPAGAVAYGPSAAVTLAVEERDGGGSDPDGPGWDVPNGALTDSGARILNLGHVDVASIVENGALVTRIKDDTSGHAPVFRELDSVVLQVLPGAKRQVPAGRDDFAFIADPGEDFWLLPAVQNPALLWPGWSTELIAPGVLAGGVEWRLTAVEGPGEFALFESGPFGEPEVRWATRDGITATDSLTIAPVVHAHGNWAFTAEGVYCLAFDRTATLAAGGGARTASSVLAIAVGEVDVRRVDPAGCFAGIPGEPDEIDETPVLGDELTEESAGGIAVLDGGSGFTPGQLVTVQVDEQLAGEWVSVWLHSDPAWLGWAHVGASGAIQVRLPADAEPGAHRIVVKDRAGDLVGWDALSVVTPPGTPTLPPPPGQDPSFPNQQCVGGATILSAGHIDYATRIVGGQLQSYIGDDTGGTKVYREPSSVVMWLKPSSAVRLPAGVPQVGPAGSTVWQVPQTQNANLVWLGWNTELLNAGNAASSVTWRLDSVSGPGTVKVYTTGSFGGVSMVLNGPGLYTIPLGVHAHANWAFSAQGVYRLSFTQTATLANGRVSSDTETVTIAVGDVDPASVGGSGCGVVSNAILGADDADAAKQAAEQASAAAALAARDALPGQGVEGPVVDPIAALAEGDPVPLLLTVLGLLLLAAAAGTGVLWWRRGRAAGP